MELKIDKEFKAYMPKLKPDEYAQLEKNILNEGCRDLIVTWDRTIVDGHNRYEICQKHGIAFEIQEIEFASRDEALEWIDRNQLGKRNLEPKEYQLRIGRIYEREKKKLGRPAKDNDSLSDQVDHLKTHQAVAEEFGLGEETVKRYGERAKLHTMAVEVDDEEAAEAAKDMPQAAVKRALKKAKSSTPKPRKKPSDTAEAEKERKRIEREQAKAAAEAIKEEKRKAKEEAARKKQEAQELAAKMTAFEKAKALAATYAKTTHELCAKMIQAGEDTMRKVDYLKAEKNHSSHGSIILDIKNALSKADEIKATLKSIEARIQKWN